VKEKLRKALRKAELASFIIQAGGLPAALFKAQVEMCRREEDRLIREKVRMNYALPTVDAVKLSLIPYFPEIKSVDVKVERVEGKVPNVNVIIYAHDPRSVDEYAKKVAEALPMTVAFEVRIDGPHEERLENITPSDQR